MQEIKFITIPADQLENLIQRVVQSAISQHMNGGKPDHMNVDEAAAYLGRAKSVIYHLTASNKIPHRIRAKKLVFSRQELDAWLKSND